MCACVRVVFDVVFGTQLRHLKSNYQIAHIPYLSTMGFTDRLDTFEEMYLHWCNWWSDLMLRANIPLEEWEQQQLLEMKQFGTFTSAAADHHRNATESVVSQAEAQLVLAKQALDHAKSTYQQQQSVPATQQAVSSAAEAAALATVEIATKVVETAGDMVPQLRLLANQTAEAALEARNAAAGGNADEEARNASVALSEQAATRAAAAAISAQDILQAVCRTVDPVRCLLPPAPADQLNGGAALPWARPLIDPYENVAKVFLCTGSSETGCVLCHEKYATPSTVHPLGHI